MDIQVVEHQVDRFGRRIMVGQLADYLSELGRRPIWRRPGEVLPSLGFYRAEHIGRAATLLLVISLGHLARRRRLGRSHVGV